MALKSTVFKADLQIADLDRGYYADHALTLARHPSETDERMMVRLLAFALWAEPELAFGAGLSTDDEPDLWKKDLTGAVDTWIQVGLPDEKDIRRACGRAGQVKVLAYGGRPVGVWWGQVRDKLARSINLEVIELPAETSQAMTALVNRTMRLQCTLQDGHLLLTNGQDSVAGELIHLQRPPHG